MRGVLLGGRYTSIDCVTFVDPKQSRIGHSAGRRTGNEAIRKQVKNLGISYCR